MQHELLRRFAESCLATVAPKFRAGDVKVELGKPERIGAIFPFKEWECESPLKEFFPIQDWVLFHGCAPNTGARLVVFFKVKSHSLAVIWLILELHHKTLILKESYHVNYSEGNTFCAGGLRLEVVAPLRRWRLVFNGLMEDLSEERDVHVKINARFASFSRPFEFPREIGPSKFARRYKDSNKTKRQIREDMRGGSFFAGYEQAGSFYCEIEYNKIQWQDVLFGAKLRYIGGARSENTSHLSLFHRARHHFGYGTNGAVFHIVNLPHGKCYGFCYTPSAQMQRVAKGRLKVEQDRTFTSFNTGSLRFKGSWSTTKMLDIASPTPSTQTASWKASSCWGSLRRKRRAFDCGVLTLSFPDDSHPSQEEINRFELLQVDAAGSSSETRLVVAINEQECRNPWLTRNGASFLAELSALSEKLGTFVLPKALVVTSYAYEKFIATESVARILKDAWGEFRGCPDLDGIELKISCEECVSKLSRVDLPLELRQLIEAQLQNSVGPLDGSRALAVRPLMAWEDSEDKCNTGKMATFLNLKTLDSLWRAIVDCWASQFSHAAVSYRSHHGQKLLSSEVTVLVQEMMEPDTAGLMVTCEPETGRPGEIILTASYGLRESSAPEGDTFILNRTESGGLHLAAKLLAEKDPTVICLVTGGTLRTRTSVELADNFCLTDIEAKAIGHIGVQIEEHFDMPCAIEWALRNGRIYILQLQLITSIFNETDFEMRHDLNVGVPTDREVLCRSNAEELLPGCLSPMTVDILKLNLDVFMQHKAGRKFRNWKPYGPECFHHFGKRAYVNFSLNLCGQGLKQFEKEAATTGGFAVKNHEALQIGIFHESLVPVDVHVKSSLSALKNKTESAKLLCEIFCVSSNFEINLPMNATSSDMLFALMKQLKRMSNVFQYYSTASFGTTYWTLATSRRIKINLAIQDDKNLLMLFFAELLRGTSGGQSVQILQELQHLAGLIENASFGASFSTMKPEAALDALRKDNSEAGMFFADFLQRYGYRSYRELELTSVPWDIDPLPLIKALQKYPKNGPSSLTRRMNFSDQVLRMWHHTGVRRALKRVMRAYRAKDVITSVIAKCFYVIRQALLAIGKRMQQENRLPKPDLIFFLTLDEAFRLTVAHNPGLVSRAMRRKRLHSEMKNERYPIIVCGIPKPEAKLSFSLETPLKGRTISDGTASGPARVIEDLEKEAHLIRQGDIVITRCIDIGWAPYFPLLSGLVTEVGGILSYGGVMAIELGLPAILGVTNATREFCSGDVVFINGRAGTVGKLPTYSRGISPAPSDQTRQTSEALSVNRNELYLLGTDEVDAPNRSKATDGPLEGQLQKDIFNKRVEDQIVDIENTLKQLETEALEKFGKPSAVSESDEADSSAPRSEEHETGPDSPPEDYQVNSPAHQFALQATLQEKAAPSRISEESEVLHQSIEEH